ncbi:ribosome rescue GTPase HflX [Chromobacterium sphagni]|uniref:GTPase HflX n=1 Tax=Chromobacterium sphagni TaxID=1903179 RepID=A0A1S1X140_9NEIS|nr:ribosome rescue GTPase HflX [Chromobacterium sphagni]OHX13110.1 GTPase HflX [Chromobacterium sphagni]OHX19382.1 GTPase HflX [Chromobacterium sphagni]
MFDRPDLGDQAILVSLDFGDPDYQESVAECAELVRSSNVEILGKVEGKRQRPDAALFAGKGKVEEIAVMVRATGANVVIFNHALSPGQERNLERALQCRVIDRNSLILDIFAQRARSHEGKLQVELAQLSHLSTRLVRGWTHLERQKGGIGLRGPGETQLETDRRLLGIRVKALKDRLAQVQKQRTTQRRSRSRAGIASVSIVGYTNAGKSTLFNALTKANIYAADQLFATLDTTSRKLFLHHQLSVVLSDTVGFIRDLPHTLVAAFRATLEETLQANLLLHVVDCSNPMRDAQIEEVNKVLAEIDADGIEQLIVWNKCDLREELAPELERDAEGRIVAVRVSALTGAGLELLREAIAEKVQPSANNHKEPYEHVAE